MEKIVLNELIIYKFASKFIDANSYVLLENQDALIVDPNESPELETFLSDKAPKKVTILLTHEHIDHVIGVARLQKKYQTKVICQKQCAEFVSDVRKNQPSLVLVALEYRDDKNGTNLAQEYRQLIDGVFPFSVVVAESFEDNISFVWQGKEVFCKRCRGHSPGSCCIVLDKKIVFTGDSLIWGYPVITRFPGGSKKDYLTETKPFLDSLSDDMLVLAGHGKSFRIEESRRVDF